MVNQWGRDGNFGSGSASGSRSAGGIIIPAIVALIIGAGGGYAGGRFLSGVSTSDLAARDKKITELNQTLSEMKFDNQGSATQQTVLRQRIKDLEGQVDSLKRTKDSLKKYADQQASKVGEDAQAEIHALQKQVDDAAGLQGQLARAQKSMKVSELQIIELEDTIRDQKSSIAKLQESLQQNSDQVNPAIASLQGQKQMLEAQLAEAKSAAGDIPELKSRIASLEDQLAKRGDDVDTAYRQQILGLQRQKDALQAKLDAAVKSATDADAQKQKIAGLQKRLDEMADGLADRDEAARDAAKQLKQAKAELDDSEKQRKVLQDRGDALAKTQDDLKKQMVALNATIASLKAAAQPVEQKPSADDDQNVDTQDSAELTPRQRSDVEKAVEDLPGYANLGSDQKDKLVGMLQKGECITDSLKAAYGHVSPIALRSLFRDLGGRC